MVDLNKVLEALNNAGARTFYVGGYVRDELLGIPNKDIDVEIHNLSFQDVSKVLGSFGKVATQGASFGILKLAGLDIDFSIPRRENKVGNKHKDFETIFDESMSLEDACLRRDFTINALLKDTQTSEIIDFYGGLSDIEKGVLREVNPKTFIEDPLRALRACQFASRFNFTISDSVIQLAKSMDYSELSKERLMGELEKGMYKSEKPSIMFQNLKEMGILDSILPELGDLVGCEQNPKYHAEGDVFNHTMMVLDYAKVVQSRSIQPNFLLWGALCHDMGKPSATYMESEKITSYKHAELGVAVADKFLRRLTNQHALIKYCKQITEYHMVAHNLDELSNYKFRKLMVKVNVPELLLFSECDTKGRINNSIKRSFQRKKASIEERIADNSNSEELGIIKPDVEAKDLMKLGMTPSPKLGEALGICFQRQLSGMSKLNNLLLADKQLNPHKYISPTTVEMVQGLVKSDKSRIKNLVTRTTIVKTLNSKSPNKYDTFSEMQIPFVQIYLDKTKRKYTMTPIGVYITNVKGDMSNDWLFNIFETNAHIRLSYWNNLQELLEKHSKYDLSPFTTVYNKLSKKTQ